MVDDYIVQGAAVQQVLHILKKLPLNRLVDGVQQDGLFVQQQIGIVRHPLGHGMGALEQGMVSFAGPHPEQIVSNRADTVH